MSCATFAFLQKGMRNAQDQFRRRTGGCLGLLGATIAMINIAFGLFEFTLRSERTPIAIAARSDTVSERLREIALEECRSRLRSN